MTGRSRRARTLSLGAALLASCLLSAPPSTGARALPQAAPTADRSIDTSDRQEVVDTFLDVLVPALAVPVGWTGSVAGCQPGAPSAAAQAATLEALNYLRAMAGLDAVTLDPAMSANAQQTALMMEAKGELSHFPDSSWPCHTSAGASTAGKSNLYLGRTGADAMVGYLRDPGGGNYFVGHRRWILKPTSTAFGSGSTAEANALQVFGGGAGTTDAGATQPTWIPWPPAGYVPADLEPGGRWSLSASSATVSFDDATVQMSGPDGAVPVTVNPTLSGYGPNTVVWEAGVLADPTPDHDVSYTVTVSGVTDNGSPLASHTYDVTLVAPARPFAAGAAPGFDAPPQVGVPLSVGNGTWSPQPTGYRYQWFRDGVRITGTAGRSYTPRPADAGTVLSVRVIPTRPYFTSGGTLVTASAAVQPGPAPVLVTAPTLSGRAQVGKTLYATPGTWRPKVRSFTFQWLRGTTTIAGATRSAYRVKAADRGKRLRVVVRTVVPGYDSALAKSPRTPTVTAG